MKAQPTATRPRRVRRIAKSGAPPERRPAEAARDLVCDQCGQHSPAAAVSCEKCGSKRFAPSWVRELRRINRSFAVQVTDAHPAAEEPGGRRLTLYKWWPGGKATFNVPTLAQWERVKSIIDTDLAPFLEWAVAKSSSTPDARRDKALKDVADTDPLKVARLVKGIRLDKVTDNDVPQIAEARSEIAEVLVGADEGLRRAIRQLVAQLPKQGEKAVRQLSDLMGSLTLSQIASITSEVRRRLGLLDLLKERAMDDRTYEITGDGSIHRLLESAMWIVDERYWLMHSNTQLRKIVGDQFAKADKQYELKRPDFVCGTVDKKLIIIELKRPSHLLDVPDLNQLERYVVICEEYSNAHTSHEAILVGTKQSDDLRRTLKIRGGSFRVLTFVDMINDAERRYKKYLDAISEGAADLPAQLLKRASTPAHAIRRGAASAAPAARRAPDAVPETTKKQ